MRRLIFILICLGGWSATLRAAPLTVAALQKQMAAGGKITLIDVRDTYEFVQGHIPGAINIPASLCPQKNLPPLGKVVVYDDGLGRRGTAELNRAVAALAAKPGITADVLKGGFAAWESAQGPTTRPSGLKKESFHYLNYSELQAMASDDVVILDLRKLTPAVRKTSATLTDLSQEFPGKRVRTSAPSAGTEEPPLIVLIDSGDGSAEAAARALKAGGVGRYAILSGGELTIARKGRPGLERSVPATHTLNPTPAANPGQ